MLPCPLQPAALAMHDAWEALVASTEQKVLEEYADLQEMRRQLSPVGSRERLPATLRVNLEDAEADFTPGCHLQKRLSKHVWDHRAAKRPEPPAYPPR